MLSWSVSETMGRSPRPAICSCSSRCAEAGLRGGVQYAREIHRAALLVAADELRNSRNMLQVPRQKIQALLGVHRMAVEAYRRFELPDGV